AVERLPEIIAVHPHAAIDGDAAVPQSRAARVWSRDEAVVELLRGRLTIVGPTTAAALAHAVVLDEAAAETALLALESDGAILRGRFTGCRESFADPLEWCDRRLLARI